MTGSRGTDPAWDAVIVGGGPAGAALATRLARSGHTVLVLDRSRFPRSKPCGESLNPAAVRELAGLGMLDAVRAAGGAPIRGWRIHPQRGPGFTGGFPAAEPGLAMPRALLDAVLLEHACGCGAVVRTGERVGDLLRDGDRVVGVRTRSGPVRARLVVGADGLRSVVLRRLGLLERPPRLRKVALAAHVTGVSDLDGRGAMLLLPGGCIGVVEVGDGTANVVVVVQGAEIERVAGDREQFFDRALHGSELLRRARRSEPVLATGPFDWPARRAVADGALLVGDAAGYYDPFTGQGIFRALRGARLAADVADPALRRDELTAAALAPYERARRNAFAAGERMQHVIEAALSSPRLFALLAARLARRSQLADALVAVTGDLRPFRSLLAPHLVAQWAGPFGQPQEGS